MTTTSGKTGLNVLAFGVAIGITKAIFVLFMVWTAGWFNYGLPGMSLVADFMHGNMGFTGGIVAGLWAFFYGLIFGVLMAATYNYCVTGKMPKFPAFPMRKIRRKKR